MHSKVRVQVQVISPSEEILHSNLHGNFFRECFDSKRSDE